MSKIQIWKRITTHGPRSSTKSVAVFNMSKIQIWKRITTEIRLTVRVTLLYLICQRYKFESESQHRRHSTWNTEAVFNMSKIQIWKRITTIPQFGLPSSPLYLICQRYKFESESQPLHGTMFLAMAVFNMSKIQIWKRITTSSKVTFSVPTLYLICQRYKFESESQRL